MATVSKTTDSIHQLPADQIRLLWHVDFWDGPINGLCLYQGEKYWFELWTDDEQDMPDTPHRRFLARQLTSEQLAEEERWHELFRQKVGTHCDYDESRPEVKPKESHREFFDAYEKRAKPDYSKNRVIGWFVL